ncbi:hypothetical protein ACQ86N_07630 [Puia sp. P3]|uniref:hypothetical protein n=1 Tax=Puia sp. P3 TaxID=3423952 RepID=UPI003D66FD6B
MDEATSKQTESQVNNGDWSEGYGYQFWRCTHGFYRGDGAYGQFCIVMPQYDAVLAVTGQSPDMQKSMNIIWDHIPGGMKDGALPENPEEHMALKKELSLLELPVVAGGISVLPGVKRGGGSSLAERGGGSVPAGAYDRKHWVVGENEFGIKKLMFDFSGKGGVLYVEKDERPAKLEFGWGKLDPEPSAGNVCVRGGRTFPDAFACGGYGGLDR